MSRVVHLMIFVSCAVIPMATLSARVTVSEVPPPPPLNNTVLLDFGNNQSYRGTATPSPDIHGNFWNSVWAGAFNGPLTNAAGGVTTMGLGFDASAGTDYYNGPSGATQNPGACVIDTGALGSLGINEAVYDYCVNSAFQIQGLDPKKSYSLTFFGSHKYSPSDYTTYSICRDASYSRVVTSISLYVQSPGNPGAHNSNKVATVSSISPPDNGILYIKFQGTNSDSTVGGYLNCMQIVELPPTNAPPRRLPSWRIRRRSCPGWARAALSTVCYRREDFGRFRLFPSDRALLLPTVLLPARQEPSTSVRNG